MEEIKGYLVSLDKIERAKQIAKLFCGLSSDAQAAFFNEVAINSRTWPKERIFQWRYIQCDLSADGKRVIDELKDHTDNE